jgi:flavin-dependent dehydrogenase
LWERPLAISSIPYGYISYQNSGAWCVGDQAAVIPSFTGDGMAIALHSGALAAEMCLDGGSADQHQRMLRAQLRKGMLMATWLSQAMVTAAGRALAPFALAVWPQATGWIARSTRIPNWALRSAGSRAG